MAMYGSQLTLEAGTEVLLRKSFYLSIFVAVFALLFLRLLEY